MISKVPPPHESDLKFLQQWLSRPNMGNCSFVGADRHIYERNTSGLMSLAMNDVDNDPLTKALLYSVPRLYHRAVVDPLHRLFGKWVKKPAENFSDKHQPTADAGTSRSQDNDTSASPAERSSSATSSTSQTVVNSSSASQCTSQEESFDPESNIFLYRDSHFHRIANVVGTLISSLIPIGSIVVLYFVTSMPLRLAVLSCFTAIFSIALSLLTSAKRVEIFAATAAFASVQVVFVGSTNSF